MSKHIYKFRIRILSLITIIFLLIAPFSTIVSATVYDTTFTKGTEFFQVATYNETTWQTTVNPTSTPSDWFGGDANITGAQSKFTTMGWVSSTKDSYEILSVFFPQIMLVKNYGYNETEINNNFTTTYELTTCLRSEWYFVSGVFNESSNSVTDMPILVSNPTDYKTIMDDYNLLVYSIQNSANPFIFPFKSFFPNVTADTFLWNLAMSTLAMGTPISSYIQDLVDSLSCENASYSGKTLIIERTGETNYTVEITYGAQVTMTTFVVKNDAGTMIYQFVSLGNTNWIVYIIVGVIIACFSGLMVYMIYRKKKFNKLNR